MQEMESQDVEFVIPLPGNDKLYGIMQEYHDGKAGPMREYTGVISNRSTAWSRFGRRHPLSNTVDLLVACFIYH